MICYKINVIEELKARSYSQAYLLKSKLLSSSTLEKLRKNETNISSDNINTICILLNCQPGDILEEKMTDQEKIKYFDFLKSNH